MFKKILLLVFCFISFFSISQNPFSLTKSTSFGLNQFSNRDDAYISIVDNDKNIILVGTTERDSTLTDILVTKLDQNHQLVWQKRHSVPTDLSYDIPLKAFVSSTNDVIIFGSSGFKNSVYRGLLFYIKYNKDGDEVYSKTIGSTDGSDYKSFVYFDVKLNNDDTFNVIYAPFINYQNDTNEYRFLKINTNGNTTKLFNKTIINNGISGKVLEDKFYFILKKYNNPDNENEGFLHYFLNIDDKGNEKYTTLDNRNFHDYFINTNLTENLKINIDVNQNIYLTAQNLHYNDTKEKINITLIGADNLFKYNFSTSSENNYFLIGSFINSLNKLILIVNSLTNNSLLFLSIDENSTLIKEKEITSLKAIDYKLNKDGTFFITTSNSNIRLFSDTLNEINSFNNSDTYNLVDFSKIDDNTIISFGVEEKKTYSDSKFTADLNLVAEKINKTNILNRYTFSGEGTSASFQHIIEVDNNNDYIVLSREYLSPKCAFNNCGGSPTGDRIIKYNSNLIKLWEFDLTGQVNNITSNYNGENLKIDSSNNIYLNLENKERNKGYLYKISSDGKLVYKKESIKSKEVIINENSNKIYLLTDGISYTDTSTWETFNWSELWILNLKNGDFIKKKKFENKYFFNHIIYNDYLFVFLSKGHYYENHTLSLFKEDLFVFERLIDLKYDAGINPYSSIVKNDGTLIFSSYSSSDFSQRKLHKLTLDNNYSFTQINEQLNKLLSFNDKIYSIDKGGYINFYDENFKLIKKGDFKYNDCCSGFDFSLVNNTFFIQWSNPNGNNSAFLNENLDVVSEFSFKNLFEKNYKFDKDNNLVSLSTLGYGFEFSYSWTRGLLSIYIYNSTLNLEDINFFNNKEIIKVFPNPTSNIFTIDLINNSIKKIELYSINGQLLNTYFKNKINLENFISGLYLLKVFTEKGTIINSKILKQ